MESVFDLYKDSLEDVINSNINDRVLSRNNFLCLSKLSIPAFWLEKVVLLLFKLFGNNTRAISSKNNNSNIFSLGNLLSKLSLIIVPNDLSNLLLKSDDCKL